jgi:aspartate racemase
MQRPFVWEDSARIASCSAEMIVIMAETTFSNPHPEKTRCLGLVSGLGVGAAVHYYQHLALAAEAQGRALDMVTAHARTARVFEYVEAGDRDGLAAYLNSFILRLQAAGAEIAVVPAVTPHYCIGELLAISPLPVLSIFDPLVRQLASRQIRRISVFGAEPVMKAALYGEVGGQGGGVEVVSHPSEELEYIRDTYLALLRTGIGTEQQHAGLTALAHTILQRDRVDAIVLAGTDLALLFNPANTDFPYLDCAELHLAAIKEAIFR